MFLDPRTSPTPPHPYSVAYGERDTLGPCQSGVKRLPAMSRGLSTLASRSRPPSAWPRPRREESTSVVSESFTPATHTQAAAPAKISSSIGKDNEPNMFLAIPRRCLQYVHAHHGPPAASKTGEHFAVDPRWHGNKRAHGLIDTCVWADTNGPHQRRSACQTPPPVCGGLNWRGAQRRCDPSHRRDAREEVKML